ncbi:TonB-dependent receptor [Saccharophagus degradans]|uniref:TonB-dependent receptor n=1 Tax=Saccharophagus degradans TaxID=86304 RepID=UPI002477D7B9|nr:TonB-dependent receptor [Saccharophagus degradans]WGO96553.1 TonB-dependent receptor [Saccharophagus degradans]
MKVFTVGMLSLAVSAAIQAQENDNNIETMLITGSRIVESIDEVPVSVTIIDRTELERQLNVSSDIQNLLAMYVPGISAGTGTSSNFGQTLRGRAALVMIDGVPQSTPLRNGALGIKTLDPNIIERVEIIQGATSIYGNGAAGGIINYITRTPGGDKTAAVEVDTSTRFSAIEMEDSVGGKVSTTLSGTNSQLSYVASYSYEKNGVLRDADGDALGTQYGLSQGETHNIFAKLGVDVSETQKLAVTYNYYESQQDSDWVDVIGNISLGEKTYAVYDPASRPEKAEPQGPRGNTNIQAKYTNNAIFSNTQVEVDAYTQTIENVFFWSTRLGNPDIEADGGQSMIKSDKNGLRATFNTLASTDIVDVNFIYGVDLLQDVTSQPLVDGRMWVPEMDMRNKAGFLQSKWVFNNDLILKAGIRREKIGISVDDYNTLKLCTSPDVCSTPLEVTGGDIDTTATTYNIAFRYNGIDAFNPYISYSEGADVPDIGVLLRSATVEDISLIQTEASVVKSREIGFVSTFDQFRFEARAYQSKSNLGSRSTLDPNTGIYITERAPQKIWGYEGIANFSASDSLDFTVTFGRVEGKHTETDSYIGGRQIGAPKLTFVTNWNPVNDAALSLSVLKVLDRNRFERDESGFYSGDEGNVTGYTVVNLTGSYDFGNFSVYGGIENLFNADYFPARAQALTYAAFNVKGIGRTVNIGVKLAF